MNDSANTNESMTLAIGQIESALGRMENALAKISGDISVKPPATPRNHALEEQLARIRSRHARLRHAAQDAIRQIDSLTTGD